MKISEMINELSIEMENVGDCDIFVEYWENRHNPVYTCPGFKTAYKSRDGQIFGNKTDNSQAVLVIY